MRILNLGSLNIDLVYQVDHIVRGGETIPSLGFQRHAGGKGLNQSVALGRAGAEVYHAGKIGPDGVFLIEMLNHAQVDTSQVLNNGTTSGTALIQVDQRGQNCIILHGGANQEITKAEVGDMLEGFGKGDLLLLQNEINNLDHIIHQANKKQLEIFLNPSPISSGLLSAPLDKINGLILNEIEGQELSGQTEPKEILRALKQKYPAALVVLTLGQQGAWVAGPSGEFRHGTYQVKAVDTTAAGDTFTGYFLASLSRGMPIPTALEMASKAAAITVTRAGAAPSIPSLQEVERFQGSLQ